MRRDSASKMLRILVVLIPIVFIHCGRDTTVSTCSLQLDTSVSGSEVGIKQTSFGSAKVAQSFRLSSDTTFTTVYLKLLRLASASGTLTLVIETNSGASPSGTAINMANGSSSTSAFSVASVSATQSAFYAFTFASAVTVQANQTYWVVVSASYSASNTDVVQWLGTNTNPYISGEARVQDSVSTNWSTTGVESRDLLVRLGCTE